MRREGKSLREVKEGVERTVEINESR